MFLLPLIVAYIYIYCIHNVTWWLFLLVALFEPKRQVPSHPTKFASGGAPRGRLPAAEGAGPGEPAAHEARREAGRAGGGAERTGWKAEVLLPHVAARVPVLGEESPLGFDHFGDEPRDWGLLRAGSLGGSTKNLSRAPS